MFFKNIFNYILFFFKKYKNNFINFFQLLIKTIIYFFIFYFNKIIDFIYICLFNLFLLIVRFLSISIKFYYLIISAYLLDFIYNYILIKIDKYKKTKLYYWLIKLWNIKIFKDIRDIRVSIPKDDINFFVLLQYPLRFYIYIIIIFIFNDLLNNYLFIDFIVVKVLIFIPLVICFGLLIQNNINFKSYFFWESIIIELYLINDKEDNKRKIDYDIKKIDYSWLVLIYILYIFYFFSVWFNIISIPFDIFSDHNNNFFSFFLTFNIDILGIIFVGLSILLIGLCLILIWPIRFYDLQFKLYCILLLLILILLNIVFLAADILTFFIAFEGILIPIILIISFWGSPNKRQANNYLIFYTAIGAVPMIIGIIYIWNQLGDMAYLNFNNLCAYDWSVREQRYLWLVFFIPFAIKTPIVPVHIWLPKAHVDAPTTGSVILAGLLLKIGLFGFLRLLYPVFPLAIEDFSPYIMSFATVGVLYSSLITIRQIDIKRIIAYSSIAHINIAIVSLCSITHTGIVAAIFVILSHGFISSALFFLVGFLYHRYHQRVIFYYGGLATLIPIFTIFIFIFTLANIAFPLTSGFIGEFCCLVAITSTSIFLGFLNACSILFTTVYSLFLFNKICLGSIKGWIELLVLNYNLNLLNKNIHNNNNIFLEKLRFSNYDLIFFEVLIIIILLFFTLFLGIYPYDLISLLNIISIKVYFINWIKFECLIILLS